MEKRTLKEKIGYWLRVFYRKRIIYSTKYQPAVLVFSFNKDGKNYVRVAFDNRQKYENKIPMIDIETKYVTGIKYCYSQAEVFLWSLIGVKADNKHRPVKKLKK